MDCGPIAIPNSFDNPSLMDSATRPRSVLLTSIRDGSPIFCHPIDNGYVISYIIDNKGDVYE
jgi:hypothetical protein